MIKVGIGQDSHRITDNVQNVQNVQNGGDKPLILGGVCFDEKYCLEGNSDADVIVHAITNAISGVTGKPILGEVADALCNNGVKDSKAYLNIGLEDLSLMKYKLSHCSVSVECKRPKLSSKIPAIRLSLAKCLGISEADVGITATTGEGLTDFGKGLGIQAFCAITAQKIYPLQDQSDIAG